MRKLTHADGVLDDGAGPADARFAAPAVDGADTEVQLGSQATVQAHFFVTQPATLRRLAQIDEGVVHRAFDLVGESARQQYPGNVCLDEIDSPHGVRVGSGVKQSVQVIRKGAHRALPVTSAPIMPHTNMPWRVSLGGSLM